jgi:hypothetical protein
MAHNLCKSTKELIAVITDEGCTIDNIHSGGRHVLVTYSKDGVSGIATLPRSSKVDRRYRYNLRRDIRNSTKQGSPQ